MEFIKYYVEDLEVPATCDSSSVHAILKDGVALCKLMNALEESSVKEINDSKTTFKQRENIGKFLSAAKKYGVPDSDQFQTLDLHEAQNMGQVISQLHSLGIQAESKHMVGIGPKEAQKNERAFTEEQLRAGEGLIGLDGK